MKINKFVFVSTVAAILMYGGVVFAGENISNVSRLKIEENSTKTNALVYVEFTNGAECDGSAPSFEIDNHGAEQMHKMLLAAKLSGISVKVKWYSSCRIYSVALRD
jgi:hypothetical protein